MQENKIVRSWGKGLMRSLIIGMIFMAVALSSRAQGPGTTGLENGATGPDGSGGAGVPIDGGLSLLMAAGALYGAKKAYQKRKK